MPANATVTSSRPAHPNVKDGEMDNLFRMPKQGFQTVKKKSCLFCLTYWISSSEQSIISMVGIRYSSNTSLHVLNLTTRPYHLYLPKYYHDYWAIYKKLYPYLSTYLYLSPSKHQYNNQFTLLLVHRIHTTRNSIFNKIFTHFQLSTGVNFPSLSTSTKYVST